MARRVEGTNLQRQIKAAIKVNTKLLRLYWDLGQDIVLRQMESSWGSSFFDQLSRDLRSEFPGVQGFSVTNLKYCKRFYQFYAYNELLHQEITDEYQVAENISSLIRQQVADEFEENPIFHVPWFHHVQIFTKCKTVEEAMFYVRKVVENGWSRAVLMNFIQAGLFSAQGKAQANFSRLLPEPQSDLANPKCQNSSAAKPA